MHPLRGPGRMAPVGDIDMVRMLLSGPDVPPYRRRVPLGRVERGGIVQEPLHSTIGSIAPFPPSGDWSTSLQVMHRWLSETCRYASMMRRRGLTESCDTFRRTHQTCPGAT